MDEILKNPTAAGTISCSITMICIAFIAVGCTVAVQWRKRGHAEIGATLTNRMIDAGMSGEEIAKVLEADHGRTARAAAPVSRT